MLSQVRRGLIGNTGAARVRYYAATSMSQGEQHFKNKNILHAYTLYPLLSCGQSLSLTLLSSDKYCILIPRHALSFIEQYDVAIVGGGPGGYVAAIKAGQLGLKVSDIFLPPKLMHIKKN